MIEVIDNIQFPSSCRSIWGEYPYDKLDVDQGFIVPASEAGQRECEFSYNGKTYLQKKNKVHQAKGWWEKETGFKFKTRADADGNVYVKRIA